MSDHADQVAALYKQLAQSEGGKHLIAWIEQRAKSKREQASKSEPIPAWGELRFADGLDDVRDHITQMANLDKLKAPAKQD